MNRRHALREMVCWAGVSLVAPVATGWACRIKTEFDHGAAESAPREGATEVIVVSVRHTHRRCTLPIEKTKFVATGMKILGATPWKATASGEYERKLRVVYLKAGTAKLRVVRDCSRGGCTREFEYTVGAWMPAEG